MRYREFILFVFCLVLVACNNVQLPEVTSTIVVNNTSTKTPIPSKTATHTIMPIIMDTSTATFTATPSLTHTPIPSITPSPTVTPPGGYVQFTLGIPYAAINNVGCGGTGVVTMDHDSKEGSYLHFWQANPDVPKPIGFTYRSRDGRRGLDYCTFIGYPITFEMEEGVVTQNRIEDGVLDIRITKGPGTGLTMTHGHINPDTDLDIDGVQFLKVGTIVKKGDVIGYTDRFGISSDGDASTQTGIIGNSGYLPEQEMMLIGPDGQPNILYDE